MIYKFKPYKKSEIIKNHLNIGGENPLGERIDVTSLYFTRGGKPWMGIMGEYHFSRAHSEDWYRELCKMKAGGITIVATYLFWIYHEEIEGEFDFSGDRDIRKFVLDAKHAGLDVIIRIGPWAHGECRNGGFPDWLMKKPYKLRDNNDRYMEKARIWYEKIYEQVKGLFYKDGGSIIGIQFENELVNNAEHLLALKNMALEIGFNAPIYTVTGWNSKFGAEIPVDEVVPVFAAYVEAPWANHMSVLPPSPHYVFDTMRNDSAVGTDVMDDSDYSGWRLPYERYPFATCELGAGLQPTHHRRIRISGMDAYALSLVKLGCGNNLVGYYMYHGGTNKIGKLSALNETRASGYPNDYPILNYDFHTAITEYGETREQYRLLNILHLFIADFGEMLAPMENVGSENNISAEDFISLRYCMRTDGKRGFVFVNHYQRLTKLNDNKNVIIDTGSVKFPVINICGDKSFIMPFNIDLSGSILEYSTAQLLCRDDNTYFFVAIDGIEPKFKFENTAEFTSKIGLNSATQIDNIKIVTLSWKQAKYMRKLSDKLCVGDKCDLYKKDGKIEAVQEGSFAYYEWNGTEFVKFSVERKFNQAKVEFEIVNEPFAPKYTEEPKYLDELNIGGKRKCLWKKITVSNGEGFVEIPDEFDAAQLYADGELVADIFYYGEPWRVPAKMLFGKECYVAMSELKDDCYKEF